MVKEFQTVMDDAVGHNNKDKQARKVLITQNNPEDYGLSHDVIRIKMQKLNAQFYAMCDEIGNEGGIYHTHIFFYRPSPVRFSTIKKLFPHSHIDFVRGRVTEVIQYLKKEGKWEETSKAETSVPESYEDYGTLPSEKVEKKEMNEEIINLFDEGYSINDIINNYPSLALRTRALQELYNLRHLLIPQSIRSVDVIYIYGESEREIFKSIYKNLFPNRIARITNYDNSKGLFDPYNGEDIIVFDGFNGQIGINDMIRYLDIYPIDLPARFNSREALYSKVYIVASRPIDQQYTTMQATKPKVWNEFLNMFTQVLEMLKDGSFREVDTTSFYIMD